VLALKFPRWALILRCVASITKLLSYSLLHCLKGSDVFSGIQLGDAREKEFKQIMFDIGITPQAATQGPVRGFTWELSYKKLDKVVPEGPMTGELTFDGTYSTNETISDDVLVHLRRILLKWPLIFLFDEGIFNYS